MMIHQQLLPPKQLLLHITNTSKIYFERFAAHSKIFRRQKKVQMKHTDIKECNKGFPWGKLAKISDF